MRLKGFPNSVVQASQLLDDLMERIYALSMDTNALPEKLNTMEEDGLWELVEMARQLYDALS